MHRFPTAETILLTLQGLILAALLIRLLATRLFRSYPFFFGYLLINALQTLAISLTPFDGALYRYVWLVTQALLTCFCALIVLELYGLILRDLTGLASLAQRYVKICLGVAILGSLLLLLVEQKPRGIFLSFLVVDRAVVISLLIFVLLLTIFLIYYPIPINRNLVVYSTGYAFYFLVKGGGLLAVNATHAWHRQLGIAVIGAFTASMLFWLIGLSRQGDEKTMVIGHRWNRGDQEEILAGLKALNERLRPKGKP